MQTNKNRSFWQSAKNAFCGFVCAFRSERNIKIDVGAVIFVAFFGIEYGLTRSESALVTLAAALVLIAELFNTAVEKGLDAITTNYDENIRQSKDICAAAVTVTAVCAVICALFVFGDLTKLSALIQKFIEQPHRLIKFGIIIIYEAAIVFRKDKNNNGK